MGTEKKLAKNTEAPANSGRRSFLALTGAALGGALLPRSAWQMLGTSTLNGAERPAGAPNNRSGIRLSQRVFPNASDDYLLYLKQLGISDVDIVSTVHDRDSLRETADRFRENGFQVWNLNPLRIGYPRTMLGEDGREEEIERYNQFLHDAADAGFRSVLAGWRPGRMGRLYDQFHHREKTTRGAVTVNFEYDEEKAAELVYGRRYPAEELWEYFSWWCRRVMPAAEDAGISIGFHPAVGIPEIGGVANLFSSRAGYEKAIEIADSPRFGITFCVGPWATSPERYGEPAEAIRHFGAKHIFHVHFRNISSPLPAFQETFIDNGYVDMHGVMEALYETGFTGTVIPDHSPMFVNDHIASGGVGIGAGVGLAYATGYMRALLLNLERADRLKRAG